MILFSGGTFIGGIHPAAAGTAWQIVVNDFTGFEIFDGKVYLNPGFQLIYTYESPYALI
ncbi:MAG: hypothetical protein U9N62_02335 [Thermotogota bacterium]|nr:hypothetical protein [Thermotogota bacterium]